MWWIILILILLLFYHRTEYMTDHTEVIRQAIHKTVAEKGTIATFKNLIEDQSFSPITFAALMAAERNGKLTYDIAKGIINKLKNA